MSEQAVDLQRLERIRAAFPDLALTDLHVNRDGLANDVVIVGGARVFRFPKHDWAAQLLVREAGVLELVRRYVDVAVPDFDVRTPDMVSYRFLPGDPLMVDDLRRWPAADQDAVAATLAHFLRQLHTIPRDVLAAHAIPVADAARSVDDWRSLYANVEREVMPLLMRDAQEWTRRLFRPLLDDPTFLVHTPVLINGDIGPYHVLCNRDARRVTGIIDFGTAGLGDPAVDLACLLNNYGETFLRRMDRSYPLDAATVERARFYAGTLELQWLLGGLRSDDRSWFAVHIGRARDVMPLGSGW